jgi:hypothetical protein
VHLTVVRTGFLLSVRPVAALWRTNCKEPPACSAPAAANAAAAAVAVLTGRYLEIFARKNNLRNFWVSIGNEVTGTGLPEADVQALKQSNFIPGAVYGRGGGGALASSTAGGGSTAAAAAAEAGKWERV